jgi:D-arabinose 1-dehydrogenase-like Zn-dependent alcohol dehydrogenase
MLEFADFHGIKPVIETFPMTGQGIEEALQKLDEGKIRYRGVLVAE